MLNKIIVIGRLTKDPELKITPTRLSVCSFTLAVERNYAGSGTKETDFIPVVCWRGLAETCASYLSKGKMAAVEGSLQIRSYENKNGEKRHVAEIIADSVQFLTPKDGSSPSADSPLDELPWND